MNLNLNRLEWRLLKHQSHSEKTQRRPGKCCFRPGKMNNTTSPVTVGKSSLLEFTHMLVWHFSHLILKHFSRLVSPHPLKQQPPRAGQQWASTLPTVHHCSGWDQLKIQFSLICVHNQLTTLHGEKSDNSVGPSGQTQRCRAFSSGYSYQYSSDRQQSFILCNGVKCSLCPGAAMVPERRHTALRRTGAADSALFLSTLSPLSASLNAHTHTHTGKKTV